MVFHVLHVMSHGHTVFLEEGVDGKLTGSIVEASRIGGPLQIGPGVFDVDAFEIANVQGWTMRGSGVHYHGGGTLLRVHGAGALVTIRNCGWCRFEDFSIEAVDQGAATVGLSYTSDGNASQQCVFRDLVVRNVRAGAGLRVGPADGDVARQVDTSVFERIMLAGCATGLVQTGANSVSNRYRQIRFFCDEGARFEGGDVRVDGCDFVCSPTRAAADIVVESGAHWATIRDCYHETRAGAAYSFPVSPSPSVAPHRVYPTLIQGCRVQWMQPSGDVLHHRQTGPLEISACTFLGATPWHDAGVVRVDTPRGSAGCGLTIIGSLFGNGIGLEAVGDVRLFARGNSGIPNQGLS